ncbi:hypothetical protein [Mucilaginibacter sp. 3215]|uniref:hypothetical protein n=1 Tax=Mucilaginibacter sp. 3215 TaxID=3373912 RepID=UPI003D23308C
MKKLLLIVLLFAACKFRANHDGTYVSHTQGQFSIADDTLIVADTVVLNHTGFQKIRNGEVKPKAYKSRKWTLNSPDAPVMQISDGQIIIGSTTYKKLP